MTTRLLIATHNRRNLREYTALFAGLLFTLVTPDDLSLDLSVVESGDTYVDNARLKAAAYAQASGLLALADGRGVDGAPWWGPACPRRIARPASAVFSCWPPPTDAPGSPRARAPGRSSTPPGRSGGFGYDPVFYLPSHGCTMAELTLEEKNRVRHRARAAHKMRPVLERLE